METCRDPYTGHIDAIRDWYEFLEVLDAWDNTTSRYWDADPTPEIYSHSGRYGWWATILAQWITDKSNIDPEPLLAITRMIQAKDPLGQWTAFAVAADEIDRCRQQWRPYRQMLIGLAERALASEFDPGNAIAIRRRITVVVSPPQVTVDNQPIALGDDEAVCLKMVVDAAGDWVSGTDISEVTKVVRPDRQIKNARKKLGALDFLESSPGKGARVRRDWLA